MKANIAAKNPIPVQVEQGKDYYWCACGNSKKQPLCDGAHKGTQFVPKKFTAQESKTVYFCACKQTKTPVTCDGSHKTL